MVGMAKASLAPRAVAELVLFLVVGAEKLAGVGLRTLLIVGKGNLVLTSAPGSRQEDVNTAMDAQNT
jgi:hypothetical protein